MKTLYLECNMGAAGDMLMSALSDLLEQPEAFVDEMNALGLPHVALSREYKMTAGVRGVHTNVVIDGEEEHSHDVDLQDAHHHDHDHEHHHDHDHEHHHDHDHEHHHDHDHEHHHDHDHEHHHDHDHEHDHDHDHDHDHNHDHGHHHHHGHGGHHHITVADVWDIVEKLPVSDKVKADVKAVYGLIAEAEGHSHGKPIEEVHFHEVGTVDAIVDVTGVCLLMEKIGADNIVCSPVHVGSGMVRCAHGVLPVPAPATAYILRGVPSYSGAIRGELCTPTGAALLKHFASSFGPMPVMATEKIGIGVGTKEFPAANMLRAFLGETEDRAEDVAELSCNLDDCTGEEIGFAIETLMANGALDAFASTIQMKKSRPGIMLTVIARTEDAEKLTELMLQHTTTLGVRRKSCTRTTLQRRFETRQTPWGPVQIKVSEGHGVERRKAEFDDLANIARENGISLREVLRTLEL